MSWHIYGVGTKSGALRRAKDLHTGSTQIEPHEHRACARAREILVELIEGIDDPQDGVVIVKAQASGHGDRIGSLSVSSEVYSR